MPQLQLPIFPAGITHITNELGFECRDGVVTSFLGQLPLFRHALGDLRTFRMITSQFVANGNARQVDIAKAFGVSSVSVKRSVRRYRKQGPGGFYAPRRVRGAVVLTAEVVEKLQELLDKGMQTAEAAGELGLNPNTVAKAGRAGRLRVKKKTRRAAPARAR